MVDVCAHLDFACYKFIGYIPVNSQRDVGFLYAFDDWIDNRSSWSSCSWFAMDCSGFLPVLVSAMLHQTPAEGVRSSGLAKTVE